MTPIRYGPSKVSSVPQATTVYTYFTWYATYRRWLYRGCELTDSKAISKAIRCCAMKRGHTHYVVVPIDLPAGEPR